MPLTSLEICAGAGGQALGIEMAGFEHVALVELEKAACTTLISNRPAWNVLQQDLKTFSAVPYQGVDLLAGGVPCPPFSRAGKQLGQDDERDLFPEAIRLASECGPKAIMLENVRGFLDAVFDDYRKKFEKQLTDIGYECCWRLLNASDFGVPQLRPRVVFVAMKKGYLKNFKWPTADAAPAPTVGTALFDLMSACGWRGAKSWRARANSVAPTLVGGSKKHGGPDLGPTRAKMAWKELGVDGMGIADSAPTADFVGNPRLTVQMAARIQGFPDSWRFIGGKTAAYRQVGNAFPPPVAKAVAKQIALALDFQSLAKAS